MNQKTKSGLKIVSQNRKARFNYFFKEFFEAGIVLKGSEVKSLRDGKGSIADAYAIDKNGEMFLINSHIPLYRQSSYNNHNPKGEACKPNRERKKRSNIDPVAPAMGHWGKRKAARRSIERRSIERDGHRSKKVDPPLAVNTDA